MAIRCDYSVAFMRYHWRCWYRRHFCCLFNDADNNIRHKDADNNIRDNDADNNIRNDDADNNNIADNDADNNIKDINRRKKSQMRASIFAALLCDYSLLSGDAVVSWPSGVVGHL